MCFDIKLLPRGQVIDLLEATGEVPKCQTLLAASAPFGDIDRRWRSLGFMGFRPSYYGENLSQFRKGFR